MLKSVLKMKVEIRDDLLLGLDAIAGRVGQSRECLIHLALDLFIREQQRSQAIVDGWETEDAQEFSDWLRRVLKRSDSGSAAS
jgi:predicted transcriptional regulator